MKRKKAQRFKCTDCGKVVFGTPFMELRRPEQLNGFSIRVPVCSTCYKGRNCEVYHPR